MFYSSGKNWLQKTKNKLHCARAALFCGLFIGLILNIILFVPFSSAEDAEVFDLDILRDKEKSLTDISVIYHQEMNRIFNDSIKQLVQVLSTNKDLSNPALRKKVLDRISVPAEVLADDVEAFCAEKKDAMNLSTFCLALRADFLYDKYATALSFRRGTLDLSSGKQVDAVESDSVTRSIVAREILDAKKTFDAALSAYQELQTAFPLHMQFEDMKTSLLQYRDRLVDMRKQIDSFPHKFINASTTECQ